MTERLNNHHNMILGFPGGSVVKKTHLIMQKMQVQSLGREDTLEEGMETLQHSCLENPMDRGAFWATVHRVAESDRADAKHTAQDPYLTYLSSVQSLSDV